MNYNKIVNFTHRRFLFFLSLFIMAICISCNNGVESILIRQTPIPKKPDPPPSPGTSGLIITGPDTVIPSFECYEGNPIQWSQLPRSGRVSINITFSESRMGNMSSRLEVLGGGGELLSLIRIPMSTWKFRPFCKGWIRYYFNLGAKNPPYLTITGRLEKSSRLQNEIVYPGMLYNIGGIERDEIDDGGLRFPSN